MSKRSLVIKNIAPRLAEIGKIKIGGKGEMRTSSGGKQFQLPQRHDHFTITTLEKGQDGNFCRNNKLHAILEKQYGSNPKRLPVRLVYDKLEMNFQSRYARYDGKTLICSGDGEFADERQHDNTFREIQCPCHRQDPAWKGEDGRGRGKCKINGTLSVIIDGADVVGGVWKFRTTGFNSTIGLMSSLAMISRLTGGPIAGLPLLLTVAPKTTTTPDGQSTTVYVVGLTFRGTVENLLESSFKQAELRHLHHARLREMETADRRLLEDQSNGDWTDDEVEEFYPLDSVQGSGAKSHPQNTATEDINDRLRREMANAPQSPSPDEPETPVVEGVVETQPKPDPPAKPKPTPAPKPEPTPKPQPKPKAKPANQQPELEPEPEPDDDLFGGDM